MFTSRNYKTLRIQKLSQQRVAASHWGGGHLKAAVSKWGSERQHMPRFHPELSGAGRGLTWLAKAGFEVCSLRCVGGGVGSWDMGVLPVPCFLGCFFFHEPENFSDFSVVSLCAGRQVCAHTKHELVREGSRKCLNLRTTFTASLIRNT